MQKLYVVRHGQTDWNLKNLLQGDSDIELNDMGIKQVEELAQYINLDDIDLCICSPLKRTRKSADILVGSSKEIIYDPMIVERNLGAFEGLTVTEDIIRKMWSYDNDYSEYNIESLDDCLNRAKEFLDKVKSEYPDKNILIVSHACFIKALHFNIVGYDRNTDFLSFKVENSKLYTYEI